MKILIVGAGPAGLTAAYWLKRYGFFPTVIERAGALSKGGYKIDIRGKAVDILRKMGIYERVAASSTDIQKGLILDKEGKVVEETSGDLVGVRTGDDLEIMRGIFCHILKDELSDIEFIFDDEIKEIFESKENVHVQFKKNKSREFDLVIGADGIHSQVRKLVFGEEKKFIYDLGIYLSVITIPNYLNLDRTEMEYSEVTRTVGAWGAQGEPDMKVYFAFTSSFISPSNSIDLKNREQQQEAIKTVFKGIGGEAPKFLQMMSEAKDFYFDTGAQIHMDHWSKGRIVLLGDAAHCASPFSGQGLSLALVGAYVLAGELKAAKENYLKAFASYEKELRAFVKMNQKLGIKNAEFMKEHEKKGIGTWFLQFLMKVARGPLVKLYMYIRARQVKKAANAIRLKDY